VTSIIMLFSITTISEDYNLTIMGKMS